MGGNSSKKQKHKKNEDMDFHMSYHIFPTLFMKRHQVSSHPTPHSFVNSYFKEKSIQNRYPKSSEFQPIPLPSQIIQTQYIPINQSNYQTTLKPTNVSYYPSKVHSNHRPNSYVPTPRYLHGGVLIREEIIPLVTNKRPSVSVNNQKIGLPKEKEKSRDLQKSASTIKKSNTTMSVATTASTTIKTYNKSESGTLKMSSSNSLASTMKSKNSKKPSERNESSVTRKSLSRSSFFNSLNKIKSIKKSASKLQI